MTIERCCAGLKSASAGTTSPRPGHEYPFIEVTTGSGAVISAFQSGSLARLSIAATTNESISLKPSNVSTAIRMALAGAPIAPSPQHNQRMQQLPTARVV
jgi:hypothetical protein